MSVVVSRRPLTLLFGLFLFLTACTGGSFSAETDLMINEIVADNLNSYYDLNTNAYSDWIELYNPTNTPIDLAGYAISDGVNKEPYRFTESTTIPPKGFLIVVANGVGQGLQPNFRLSAGGETVLLTKPNGQVADSLSYSRLAPDVSFGRYQSEFAYFQEPTPLAENTTTGFANNVLAMGPSVSPSGGLFTDQVTITLAPNQADSTVRFTLDGSVPTEQSPVYDEPLILTESSVLRVRTFQAGQPPSLTVTNSYIIEDAFRLPVVSLVSDPANWWGSDRGILVTEDIERRKEWERPASVEFFEVDGTSGFKTESTVRLFGRTAYLLPQKSLAVFIDQVQPSGSDVLEYPLFPERSLTEYHSFLLRSSSDDQQQSLMRDAFLQTLLPEKMSLDTQAARPVLVYVNGAYTGVYNLREKYNEDYAATHHPDVEAEEVDIITVGGANSFDVIEAVTGSAEHYENVLAYLAANDINSAEHYDYIQAQIDIESFIEYEIVQIYTANSSWVHNRKLWRPQTADGRWQWWLYDLDRAFELDELDFNRVLDMAEYDPLLRELVKSEAFVQQFAQQFATHLNITFAPERVIAHLDAYAGLVAPEMARHQTRWQWAEWDWQAQIERFRQYARERPAYQWQHLQETFGLPDTHQLTVTTAQNGHGTIQINGVPVDGAAHSGQYFAAVPITVKAEPTVGYVFVEWQGDCGDWCDSAEIVITASTDQSLTAIFATDSD